MGKISNFLKMKIKILTLKRVTQKQKSRRRFDAEAKLPKAKSQVSQPSNVTFP